MLHTKKFKVILAIVGGFVICWGLYYILGIIGDLVEKNKIYSKAEKLYSEEDYFWALKRFEMVPGFRNSEQKVKEIHIIVAKKGNEYLANGNIYEAEKYFEMIKDVPEFSVETNVALKQIENQMKEKLAKERAELKTKVPYEGMSKGNIEYSAWGPPTEVSGDERSITRRGVYHYKWIEKDEQGRIRRIKTLSVKDGFVWGEPDVSNYYVGQ